MRLSRIRRFGFAVTAIALLASACGGGSKTPSANPTGSLNPAQFPKGSFLEKIAKRGELVVGVKFDVPQFGFKNPTTDQVEGFDADMGRALAERLGVKAKFVEAISKNRIPFLQEDKVDVVFSTMTITDERKQQIDFSDVYYVAHQTFLTRKGESMTVATAANKKVCTAKGSTSELNLPAVQPKVTMVLQDGYAQCVQLLRNKQVDAVSTDDVILLQFLKQDPNAFQVAKQTFSTEPYGAGVQKGRTGLIAVINGLLAHMKDDGRWAKLYEKWITPVTGKKAPTPPPAQVPFSITGLKAPVTPEPTTTPDAMKTKTPM